MDNKFRYKIIIDPVHGDIGLSKLETELIDTRTFQRLKGIKQLGFAHTVYPNARHTRFEHSLGVMHVVGRIIESCEGIVDKNDIPKLRIAALLHDIGHYPYSHLMEKIDWNQAQKYIKKKGAQEESKKGIPQKYPEHERLGEIVLTERKDMKETLKRHNIEPKDIAAIIKGEHESIPENLISASLDADRLDYLLRDSLNTGLPYGRVDLNYIVNNLELDNENKIVIRSKARTSVEHMLMARYFMFNTVYTHKTVFAFEEMMRRIVLSLWEKDKIYKSGADIEQMVRADSDEFLSFHDGYLDKLIDEHVNDSDQDFAALCSAVKFRNPPKLVYEISELKRDEDNRSEHYVILSKNWGQKVKQLAEKYGIPEKRWIFRDIKGADFEKLGPVLSLAEAGRFKDSSEQEVRELVRIKEASGKIKKLVEIKSSILNQLSRLKPMLCRIYVVGINDTIASKINAEIDTWLQS